MKEGGWTEASDKLICDVAATSRRRVCCCHSKKLLCETANQGGCESCLVETLNGRHLKRRQRKDEPPLQRNLGSSLPSSPL